MNRVLTSEENEVVSRFIDTGRKIISSSLSLSASGSIDDDCKFDSILNEVSNANAHATNFNKDGLLYQTLLYQYLLLIQEYMKESHYKYDIDSFKSSYPQFSNHDANELNTLHKTANLMAILLSIVTPRKSKGLAITIVPKVVEGIQAKYVTGSGQTKATADRVHIFETEGGVTAHSRGGRKAKKGNKKNVGSMKKGNKKKAHTQSPMKIGRGYVKSHGHQPPIEYSYSITSLPDLAEEEQEKKLPNIVSDEDFKDVFTIFRTHSRSGPSKERDANSFLEVGAIMKHRESRSTIQLFNWGSSAFLPALGDQQQRQQGHYPIGTSTSAEDLLMPHYVLMDPSFDIFQGYV